VDYLDGFPFSFLVSLRGRIPYGGVGMLGGLLVGLVVGWVVSLFGGDQLIIQGIREITGNSITSAGYYTIFAIIGLLGGVLKNK
jgi:hypothetical protein